MTTSPLSIKAWIEFIETAIEKNDFKQVVSIKNQLNSQVQDDNKPLLSQTLYQQGWKAFKAKRFNVAQELFTWLAELNPKNWSVHLSHAALKQQLLGAEEATVQFRNFVTTNPIFPYQLATIEPAIKIGVLVSLGSDNISFNDGGFSIANGLTEVQHLLKSPQYSVALLFVEGINSQDIALFDCIINTVSDSDLYYEQLLQLQQLLTDSNKPVINHPKHSILSTRDYIAQHSHAIENLIVPKTIKLALNTSQADALVLAITEHSLHYPVLIRPVGTQNGDGFVLLRNETEAVNYTFKTAHYYLSEYYEFQSKDGFYRKYRCWCIGDEIVLNHLTVGDQWNVHNPVRITVMGNNPHLNEEEKDFVINGYDYHQGFIKRIVLELKKIIGLDYFGVDFNLTQNGEFVLFEANATMLSSFRSLDPVAFPHLKDVLDKHISTFQHLISLKTANFN
ncbi:MAG: hypothetical protein WAX77_15825 [Methylococcaceae bacterium]